MKVCPVCSWQEAGERTHCPDDGIALVALSPAGGGRPEDLVGQVVDGRYRVERIVGRGGMGTVYGGRHVVVGRPVAIKVLKATTDRSEGVLQRIVREAQMASAVKSRHIVETFDFGQLPSGSFYVVMELLEGIDLTRAMRRRLLDVYALCRVFEQVADALDLAHRAGIVHRDLKPDNVFLIEDAGGPPFVKLLDFGIAKVLQGAPGELTETGVILGTPYYMSPEQARADPVDHRTDIYALGVMMYRAFTGRLPFLADSTMGVLTRHLTEIPEMPSSIADVDVALERIILRCLEKRPDDRFQSMFEVAEALRAYAGGGVQRRMRDDPTTNEGAAGYGASSWVPGITASPAGGLPAVSGPRDSRPAWNEAMAQPSAPWLGGSPSGAHAAATSGAYAASGAHSSGAYASGAGLHASGAYAASGPHASRPHAVAGLHASGAHPQAAGPSSAPPGSSPPWRAAMPDGGEQPTSRGLVTTSRVGPPPRGPGSTLLLVLGAATMLVVGAAAAFGLFGRGAPGGASSTAAEPSPSIDPGSASGPSSETPSAARPPVEPGVGKPLPIEPGVGKPLPIEAGSASRPSGELDAPPASASASSHAEPAASSSAPPHATGARPATKPPSTGDPKSAPTSTGKKPPSEIRSPFE